MFVTRKRFDRAITEIEGNYELIAKQGKELRDLRADNKLKDTQINSLTQQLRNARPYREHGRYAKRVAS